MPTPSSVSNAAPTSTRAAVAERGYRYRSVKQELRENALRKLAAGEQLFAGVRGYEDTVIPQVLQAVLSGHDTLLLGLRGQAKTRILRAMTGLLDEYIPVIHHEEVDLPDDPFHPTTAAGKRIALERGDETPVRFMHRSERFQEKLATPDVTIADLIGEIDLVKHAQGRFLSDEATMHFGLVPRANRGIFVMNELPDLAPRIQVGLFNVLEERDVQVRGYPIRLELDTCLMFSANPEDYTNRGRIVTPLKDRIGSVVRTHYPSDLSEAMRITRENAFVERSKPLDDPTARAQHAGMGAPEFDRLSWDAPPAPIAVRTPDVMHEIIETTIAMARQSAHINQASGVSVRAAIAALECAVSAAELRAVRSKQTEATVRPSDLAFVAAAFRGKIELMLAEDPSDDEPTEDRLIHSLVGEATKHVLSRFLDLSAVEPIAEQFGGGLRLELTADTSPAELITNFALIPGMREAAEQLAPKLELDKNDPEQLACAAELVLDYLYVNNRLSKTNARTGGTAYKR
jgi:magnesium chelatase subunit I